MVYQITEEHPKNTQVTVSGLLSCENKWTRKYSVPTYFILSGKNVNFSIFFSVSIFKNYLYTLEKQFSSNIHPFTQNRNDKNVAHDRISKVQLLLQPV